MTGILIIIGVLIAVVILGGLIAMRKRSGISQRPHKPIVSLPSRPEIPEATSIIGDPDQFSPSPVNASAISHTGELISPHPEAAGGTKADEVQFSAVAEKEAERGGELQIDIFMYEDDYRYAVDDYIAGSLKEMIEKPGGYQEVVRGSRVTVTLTSRKLDFEDELTLTWRGKYLDFGFLVFIPEDYAEKQAGFTANVYTDGVMLCRLNMVVSIAGEREPVQVERRDIRSAFISYASQDRDQVAGVVFGMKKARPDLDIFFDVEYLSSGDHWEQVLKKEILSRDLLYLCWSRRAKQSEWVEREWRCALEAKGPQGIEPVPLETPDICPPPAELNDRHFNDILLYVIDKEREKKKRKTLLNLRTGESWTLMPGYDLCIGRAQTNDIALESDNRVSRQHCRLSMAADGRLYLEDLGSSNGTMLVSQDGEIVLKGDKREIGGSPVCIRVGEQQFLIGSV